MTAPITKCEAINALDVSCLIKHISHPTDPLTISSGWPRDIAEKIADQYKRFLYLVKAYPDEVIIPFREVDEFWHVHILHTKKYFQDCDNIFGQYIHHTAHKQVTEEDREFYEKGYQRTLELFEKEFPDVE